MIVRQFLAEVIYRGIKLAVVNNLLHFLGTTPPYNSHKTCTIVQGTPLIFKPHNPKILLDISN